RGGLAAGRGGEVPARELPALRDRAQQALRLLRAEALDAREPSGADRLLELLERRDAQRLVQLRNGARAHALQPQDVEQPDGHRCGELLVRAAATRQRQLTNTRGDVLPDPGDGPQPGLVEVGDTRRRVAHRLRRIAIGTDAERVGTLDLEQVGNLAQDAGNAGVL